MVRSYSDALRERVVAAMQCADSCRRVAVRFGISPSSVVKWTQRAAQAGLVSPTKMGGYRRPILEQHRDWPLDQVSERPISR